MSRLQLVFASRNRGKIVELRELLAGLPIDVFAVDEVAVHMPDVLEDADTFEANAIKKAVAVSLETGLPSLADDSGLEIDALDGAPGVHSARFAGEHGEDEKNNDKVLALMADTPEDQRTARFRSVLAFADTQGPLGDEVIVAAGACEGEILRQRRGDGGFGYDPLFFVPELGATFAELGLGPKNDRSHRARAMQAMKPRLITYFQLAKPEPSG